MKKDELRKKYPSVYMLFCFFREYYYFMKYKIAIKKNPENGFEKLIIKQYLKNTGQVMNIPPITYTEKIQWSKIYDSTYEKGLLSDKYEVRKWVENKIGNDYLVPLLGVWESFDEINFEQLPSQFVLKVNSGSGMNIIVKSKELLDLDRIKKKISFWMNQKFAFSGCGYEMHYSFIKSKIIAEKYLEQLSEELIDYKFICFSGKVYYCWVDVDRKNNHKRNIYDKNWVLQPWNQFNYSNTQKVLQKPKNYEDMIKIAEKLSQGFSHVRVDLYNVSGKIYFGEMTFTNGKGYELIYPHKYNKMLGDLWNI